MNTPKFITKLLEFLGSYRRGFILASVICSFALLYHIGITIFFFSWDVMPMVYYNIVSISVFGASMFFVSRNKGLTVFFFLGSIEVVTHQILADYFLGSYAAFHHFILLIGLLPYLILDNKTLKAAISAFCVCCIYVVMATISLPTQVKIPFNVLRFIRGMNTTFATMIIGGVIMLFIIIVNRFERDLNRQNITLEYEIKMASVIQQSFFKPKIEGIKDWDIGYYNKPMLGVSGDLFDFFRTENHLDGLGVFDVSGHGISAGLVTMIVKNIITQEFSNANQEEELWETMNNINQRIIEEKGDIENYLTGILVKTKSNKIEFVSAGHPLPIFYNAKTGECKFIELEKREVGVIGIDNFPTFFISRYLEMQPGDELFLYTDGITDSLNEASEEFGKARLLETIKHCVKKTTTKQVEYITNIIQHHQGKALPNDDITFIILKRK